MKDPLQYEGKRVVVTGVASGMGESVGSILSELGAEVHGIDVQDPKIDLASFNKCDLSDPDQIDKAVASIGGPVDSLFNCAGLPTTAPSQKTMLVNFAGHRCLTEAIVPLMPEGSSIGFISSVAGMGWIMNAGNVLELCATPDFEGAKKWCEEHEDVIGANGYGFSKEAINGYVAQRGFQLAPKGIRLNSINPGPTDTPMMPHFVESQGADFFEKFPKPIGRNSRPDEQAWAIVLLNSPRSSYITATSIMVDGGFSGGIYTGGIDPSVLMPAQ